MLWLIWYFTAWGPWGKRRGEVKGLLYLLCPLERLKPKQLLNRSTTTILVSKALLSFFSTPIFSFIVCRLRIYGRSLSLLYETFPALGKAGFSFCTSNYENEPIHLMIGDIKQLWTNSLWSLWFIKSKINSFWNESSLKYQQHNDVLTCLVASYKGNFIFSAFWVQSQSYMTFLEGLEDTKHLRENCFLVSVSVKLGRAPAHQCLLKLGILETWFFPCVIVGVLVSCYSLLSI